MYSFIPRLLFYRLRPIPQLRSRGRRILKPKNSKTPIILIIGSGIFVLVILMITLLIVLLPDGNSESKCL